jgi:hypothetical protein
MTELEPIRTAIYTDPVCIIKLDFETKPMPADALIIIEEMSIFGEVVPILGSFLDVQRFEVQNNRIVGTDVHFSFFHNQTTRV